MVLYALPFTLLFVSTIIIQKDPVFFIVTMSKVFIISITTLTVFFILSWLWVFVNHCRWPQTQTVAEPHITVPDDEECSICLEDLKDDMCLKLPCGHVFHKMCAQKWLTQKPTCALCRTPIVP